MTGVSLHIASPPRALATYTDNHQLQHLLPYRRSRASARNVLETRCRHSWRLDVRAAGAQANDGADTFEPVRRGLRRRIVLVTPGKHWATALREAL